jgi:hypothetical protein
MFVLVFVSIFLVLRVFFLCGKIRKKNSFRAVLSSVLLLHCVSLLASTTTQTKRPNTTSF